MSTRETPLTSEERNKIYTEVATGLMNMLVYENKDDSFWTLDDPNMKRFKIMLKLFRDCGKEFTGTLDIKFPGSGNRKLNYEFHNDHKKKSFAYFPKD